MTEETNHVISVIHAGQDRERELLTEAGGQNILLGLRLLAGLVGTSEHAQCVLNDVRAFGGVFSESYADAVALVEALLLLHMTASEMVFGGDHS